ncbi:hypothetical protein K3495_g5776 [Podosphaera aphanis]|nr:hypothetical protein K3495_g5776 [Podosphaera aphanis]
MRHWREVKTPPNSQQSEITSLRNDSVIHDYKNLDNVGNPLCFVNGITPAIVNSPSGNLERNRSSASTVFPTNRRPIIRKKSDDSREIMEEWFANCGARIGTLCPTKEDEFEVIRLLYTYKDLNATDLSEMPATDLYTHKIIIKEGTVPKMPEVRRDGQETKNGG